MARLRPARTCRTPNSQSWARYSLRKPRKNYVRALPHTSLLVFRMGVNNDNYDMEVTLDTEIPIQLRSNSIEAARMVANKYLESNIPNMYYFVVKSYPHNVIREHKMATGAGADRISQGMSLAFGSPVSLAARLGAKQSVFMVRSNSENAPIVKHALKRAMSKLSGSYTINANAIRRTKASTA
jgi:large subunit ribosomal protein L10e